MTSDLITDLSVTPSHGRLSSCGIPLMPVMLHVVGLGHCFGGHTGPQRTVVIEG